MDPTTLITALAIAAVTGVLTWWLTSRFLTQRHDLVAKDYERQLAEGLQARSRDAAEAQARAEEAAADYTALNDAYAALHEESQQRATLNGRRISELELSLHTSGQSLRELEQQLPHALKRIADLEVSLTAEKGRVLALQTALDAKQELAQQLSTELNAARELITNERQTSSQKIAELAAQVADHERTITATSLDESGVQAELEKARNETESLRAEAEVKQTDIKRKLAAAESRVLLLQKEIMSIVSSGGAADAAASVVAAEDQEVLREKVRAAEKRAQEAELKLSQSDTDTRKRLREAEYRVCELEFQLAEASEKLKSQG